MRRYLKMGLLLLAILPAPGSAQKKKETLVLFKDGFSFQGKVIEMKDWIVDPATGISVHFSAGGLSLYLDDGVRRIYFPPLQLHDAVERKEKEVNDRYAYLPPGFTGGKESLLPGWALEEVGDWDTKWTRKLVYNTKLGILPMKQRIWALSPYQMQIFTQKYRLETGYLTRELSPVFVKKLLNEFMKEQKAYKDRPDVDKQLEIARFFQEVGWYKEADKHLETMEDSFAAYRDKITPLREASSAAVANLLVEEMEKAHKVGQHEKARNLLNRYARESLFTKVTDRHKLLAQEIKDRYEGLKEKIEETRKALETLPSHASDRAYWTKACLEIHPWVNEDTLPRLKSFLTYAQQFARDISEKRKPSQSAEEVLALALTGWLQGDAASEPSPATARKLWAMRDLVLAYMRADRPADRPAVSEALPKGMEVSVDQVARMIPLLPPARAPEKPSEELEERAIALPDSAGGSYLLQLPPEYHPHRSYPVLLALPGGREKPEDMVKRLIPLAARDGYILAAPLWGNGSYNYSSREQAIVIDTLRDLRHAFNVDADRVFLFGWETGGDVAYDVGTSYPDQFAGVIPMNGNPRAFPTACWTNAQYLPFYTVEGEFNGSNAKANRTLFKNWVGSRFPAIYVEYKGRGSEWYHVEVENIFDWMGRKKRYVPLKQMGIPNVGAGRGEEFWTMRKENNRFYWLSFGTIQERRLNDFGGWSDRVQPATLQATIYLGNELVELKKGTEVELKGAKVWTNIFVRTEGVGQVTLYITPTMHDFTRPLQVRWNGTPLSPPKMVEPSLAVLLEDYAYTGDRTRLPYAKVEMR